MQGPFDTEADALSMIAKFSGLTLADVRQRYDGGTVGTLGNPSVWAKWFEVDFADEQYAVSNPSTGVYWAWMGKVGRPLHLLGK